MTAFWDLSTCRNFGMSIGPIPWTATNEYCIAHDIDGEDAADFFYIIRQLDTEYSRIIKEQSGS